MKDRYRWYKSFGRDIVCFLVGHKLKYTKRIKTQYYKIENFKDIPYREREKPGKNPYWENVSSWNCKCRRCRRKFLDEPTIPIYMAILKGLIHQVPYDMNPKWLFYNDVPKTGWFYPLAPIYVISTFFSSILITISIDTNWPVGILSDEIFSFKDWLFENMYDWKEYGKEETTTE